MSSSGSDDNVAMKISPGIVVKMTTKIFTVQGDSFDGDRKDWRPCAANSNVHDCNTFEGAV